MLRLGHISYSNCIPVHGRMLACGPPAGVELVSGVPRELNRELARGRIQVAPASSIEFACHSDRYLILPGLSISAFGAVRTIRVFSRSPIGELRDGDSIAIPTASATSVALLKIVMAQRFGIRAEYFWFDQEEDDPFERGAAAALYIGDIARRPPGAALEPYDLGALWTRWTGLPFVFALWQVHADRDALPAVRRLAGELIASRDWSMERLTSLAERYASEFGWSADDLAGYWRALQFGWSPALQDALREFYGRAREAGLVESAPEPVFLEI